MVVSDSYGSSDSAGRYCRPGSTHSSGSKNLSWYYYIGSNLVALVDLIVMVDMVVMVVVVDMVALVVVVDMVPW